MTTVVEQQTSLDSPAFKPMTRYRLLAGYHNEGIPGTTDDYRTIKAGEVFESEHDWYVDKWPEKFEYADNTRGAVTGFMFDPSKETIEQFTERMRRLQDQARMKTAQVQKTPAPPNPNIQVDPNASLANEIENLSTMTVAQLKSYAQEWEIDLQGQSKREDILRLIVDSVKALATTPA